MKEEYLLLHKRRRRRRRRPHHPNGGFFLYLHTLCDTREIVHANKEDYLLERPLEITALIA